MRGDIEYGDRVFVRVVKDYREVATLMTEEASSYTELIGIIRDRVGNMPGLAKLHVRNYTRGWAREIPFMFYKPLLPTGSRWQAEAAEASVPRRVAGSSPRMLCPWETH